MENAFEQYRKKIAEMEKKKKADVLLMALSTFVTRNNERTLNKSTLFFRNSGKSDEIVIGNYYYQLEPVLLLYKHLGKRPDVVLLLSTEQTDHASGRNTININGVVIETSEEEYIRNKVREMFDNTPGEPAVEVLSVIVRSEESGATTISKVMNMLCAIDEREAKKEGSLSGTGGIRLTVDIHGGPRDTQMLIQSIITLLRYKDIEIDEIYTVSSIGDKKDEFKIESANHTFDINKFVLGINEFLQYGRGNSLIAYYEEKGRQSDLCQIIKRISDSIQLCQIRAFDEAIREMKRYIDAIETSMDQDRLDDYSAVFIDTIKASFGALMDTRGRNMVINKVKWCVDKGFIQQALTIIESDMPKEFNQRNIARYDPNETVKIKNKDGKETQEAIVLSEAIDGKKQEWETRINYVFILWLRANLGKINAATVIEYDRVEEYLSEDVRTESFDKPFTLKGVSGRDDYVEASFTVMDMIKKDDELRKKLTKLFILHLALKDERNSTNHASNEKRASVDEVKAAIKAYVKLTECLFEAIGKYKD